VVQIHSPRPFFSITYLDLSLAKILSAPEMAQFFRATAPAVSLHSSKNCFQEREGSLSRVSLAKIGSAPEIAQFFRATAPAVSLRSSKNCFQEREGSLSRDLARARHAHI
jgi:hypothetical protein